MSHLARGVFRALCTPGVAHGLAADDVVEMRADGGVRTCERAGNVGIQIYVGEHDEDELLCVIAGAETLGGWLDGVDLGRIVVLTIPNAAGLLEPISELWNDDVGNA